MNIGILGAGGFGETHIKILKNIDIFHIQGFYDPDESRAKEIENKFQIKSYKNLDHLIQQCDAIDIVSATSSHYKMINKVMDYNKHIFVEKPICCLKSETDNLLHKSEKYNKIIQVGHIERYNPTIQKDKINSQNIKSIYTKRTGPLNKRNQNTSIVLDLMIHDIDLIISNISSPLTKIEASKTNLSNISDDYIECNLFFQNGINANLIASRNVNMKNERTIKIHYDKEILELDLLNKRRKKIKQDDTIQILDYNKESNPLEDEFISFYKAITNNHQPIVGVKDACAAVNIALQIDDIIKKQ